MVTDEFVRPRLRRAFPPHASSNVPRGTWVSPAVDFPNEGLTGRAGDESDTASTPSTRGPEQVLLRGKGRTDASVP